MSKICNQKSFFILFFFTTISFNYTFFTSFSQTKISAICGALTIILFFLNNLFLFCFVETSSKKPEKIIAVFLLDQFLKFNWIFFINKEKVTLLNLQLFECFFLMVFISFFIQLFFFYIFLSINKKKLSLFLKVFSFVSIILFEQLFRFKYFFIFLGKQAGFPLQLFFLPIFFNLYERKFEIKKKHNQKNINWNYLPTDLDYKNNLPSLFLWLQNRPSDLNKKINIFLTQENFFKENLSSHAQAPKALSHLIQENELFFLCGEKQKNKKNKQSVLILKKNKHFWISKKNLCPIYEEKFFAASKKKLKFIKIKINKKKIKLLTLLCSEFFLCAPIMKIKKSDYLILCVKTDSFSTRFQNILFSYGIFIGWLMKKKILWIDHLGLRMINFYDKF